MRASDPGRQGTDDGGGINPARPASVFLSRRSAWPRTSAVAQRLRHLRAVLAVSCFLVPLSSPAQTARLSTEADSVTAGRPFEVAVAVRHAPGEQTVFPRVPPGDPSLRPAIPLGESEILSVRRLPPTISGDQRTDRAVIETVTFAADSARLGPLAVAVVVDGDTVRVETNAVVLPVRSVLGGETEPYDPAPLGPPPAFASALPIWIALGLAVALALAGIGWAVVRAFRRPTRTVPVSPYAAALASLDRLDAEAPPEGAAPEAIETHVVAVRDALRAYLARRLRLPVRQATTSEVETLLAADSRLTADAADAVRRALHPTDLVAFARVRPAPPVVARLRADTRTAIEVVEASITAHESAERDKEPGGPSAHKPTEAGRSRTEVSDASAGTPPPTPQP